MNSLPTQNPEIENPHRPISDLFSAEVNRIYQANSSNQTLKKVTTEKSDLNELRQIATAIPANKFPTNPLISEDLPKSFNLNNLTGQKVTVAFLPLSDQARNLLEMEQDTRQNFIQNQSFIKTLFVDSNSQNLTSGFGEQKGFFFDLLPAEIQADLIQGGSTFTITQTFENPEQAKEWYVQNHNQALSNLLHLIQISPTA